MFCLGDGEVAREDFVPSLASVVGHPPGVLGQAGVTATTPHGSYDGKLTPVWLLFCAISVWSVGAWDALQ